MPDFSLRTCQQLDSPKQDHKRYSKIKIRAGEKGSDYRCDYDRKLSAANLQNRLNSVNINQFIYFFLCFNFCSLSRQIGTLDLNNVKIVCKMCPVVFEFTNMPYSVITVCIKNVVYALCPENCNSIFHGSSNLCHTKFHSIFDLYWTRNYQAC